MLNVIHKGDKTVTKVLLWPKTLNDNQSVIFPVSMLCTELYTSLVCNTAPPQRAEWTKWHETGFRRQSITKTRGWGWWWWWCWGWRKRRKHFVCSPWSAGHIVIGSLPNCWAMGLPAAARRSQSVLASKYFNQVYIKQWPVKTWHLQRSAIKLC